MLPAVLVFVAVIVAALNLRAGIAAVGPVLGEMLASFGAGGGTAGLITALPGIFFMVMGLGAVPLARMIGLGRTLLFGMVLTLVGTALRPWVDDAGLFIALTALVVAGIALSNVLLPAWIKRHGGVHIVSLMSLNTAFLGVSGGLGPLSALLYDGPDGWRRALFFWVWIALAQVIVWAIVAWRTGYDFPQAASPQVEPRQAPEPGVEAGTESVKPVKPRKASLLRSPSAVYLMSYFGLQSMNGYVQMGYVPQVLLDAGVSQSIASIVLSINGVLGMVGGLVMPTLISKVYSLTPYIVAMAVCAVGAWGGLLLAPAAAPLLWGVLIGLGGWAFPTALALIVARTRDPEVTARVSGFVQPVGYVLAAVGPFLIGVAYTPESPNWTWILVAMLASSVLQGWMGVKAARPGNIDDELAAQR